MDPFILREIFDDLGVRLGLQADFQILRKKTEEYEIWLGAVRHFALQTKIVDELAAKVETAGYEVFIKPKDIAIPSNPEFHARMSFFYGPLGEQVELFNPEN